MVILFSLNESPSRFVTRWEKNSHFALFFVTELLHEINCMNSIDISEFMRFGKLDFNL